MPLRILLADDFLGYAIPIYALLHLSEKRSQAVASASTVQTGLLNEIKKYSLKSLVRYRLIWLKANCI